MKNEFRKAVAGYTLVEFFLFLYYAPRLRRFSEEKDCLTIPDFFAARFPGQARLLRILTVTIFMAFMVMYVSAQFVGGGKAFEANFDLSQNTGIVITAGIVLTYTILGGFLAVSLTDVLQAFVMLLALVGLPLCGIMEMGGWNHVSEILLARDHLVFSPFALDAGHCSWTPHRDAHGIRMEEHPGAQRLNVRADPRIFYFPAVHRRLQPGVP